MGDVSKQRPVLLIAAIFSRYDEAFDAAIRTAESTWGPILFRSDRIYFTDTRFYEKEMGSGLRKQLFAFESLIDPATLPDKKVQSNDWERSFNEAFECPEERALNIDPGYLTEAKVVLATTKNRDHRIYLRDGIFAEITLFYQAHQWNASRWTYPDYKRDDYHRFFDKCRDHLRSVYQSIPRT